MTEDEGRWVVISLETEEEVYGPYLNESDAVRDAGREQAETGVRHEVRKVQ